MTIVEAGIIIRSDDKQRRRTVIEFTGDNRSQREYPIDLGGDDGRRCGVQAYRFQKDAAGAA